MKSGVAVRGADVTGTRAVLCLAGALLLSGCGKKGPLVYPDQLLPGPPPAVVLEQTGSKLRLAVTVPSRDRRDRPLREPVASLVVLKKVSCAQCPDDFREVQRFAVNRPASDERVVWIDTDVRPGDYLYQYRVISLQRDGDAGTSLDTQAVALQPVPMTPTVLARPAFGSVVAITLAADVPDGTTRVGFRLYRAAVGAEAEFSPVGSLISDDRYIDQEVRRDTAYRYAARQVVRHTSSGLYLESELSLPVTVTVQDAPQQ